MLTDLSLQPVEVVSDIRAGRLPDEGFPCNQPLLLKDFGEEWPVVQAARESVGAAVAYLNRYYRGLPITTCRGSPDTRGRMFYNEQMSGFNFTATSTDFKEFLDEILSQADNPEPPMLYIPSSDVTRWLPGFAEQHLTGVEPYNPIKLIWAGNRSRIAAHYDFPDNIACSLVGRRRFILFPPEQVANLYPGPMEFAPGGQEISLVDLTDPDFERFPKFRAALESAQVADLEVGDALFLPGMWWHHVEGMDSLNILYTHWWRNSPAYLGRPTNALMLAILSLRSLSSHQRQAWKALFDHYVFEYDPQDTHCIPESVRGMLNLPLDEVSARKLRAELLNRLKV